MRFSKRVLGLGWIVVAGTAVAVIGCSSGGAAPDGQPQQELSALSTCGGDYQPCCLGECIKADFCDYAKNKCLPRPDAGGKCGARFDPCCPGYKCDRGESCDPVQDVCLPEPDAGTVDSGPKDAGTCGNIDQPCCPGNVCTQVDTFCNTKTGKCDPLP